MSIPARRKGRTAEQELVRELRDLLGEGIARNLDQARDGGCDILGISGWSAECKRQERLELPAWWAQTLQQAEQAGGKPVLLYRQSRRPWRAVLALTDVARGFEAHPRLLEFTAEMSLAAFAALVREAADDASDSG
jgi:Holliday junction resolvase